MQMIEYVDPMNGRHYEAVQEGQMRIIKGPPEGLVDMLNLPEPFATTLHNIMYTRHIFTSADISRNPTALLGALQEALMLDVQKLTEAFLNYEKEVRHE